MDTTSKGLIFFKLDPVQEFIQSLRGLKLFTCIWLPAERKAKALICLCHGYGMECNIFIEDTGVRLANVGYAVIGIDYEGHGKSAGMRCYIKSFDNLVTDCATFFRSVAVIREYIGNYTTKRIEYREKARFLYGESMGGAVALLIHRKQPDYWSGAVLVAPMCKISKELKPHPLVINILKNLTAIIPKWKLVPTEDIVDKGFKDPEKRQKIRANPYVYQGRTHLKTGFELLNTSLDIEKRLDEVVDTTCCCCLLSANSPPLPFMLGYFGLLDSQEDILTCQRRDITLHTM